MPTINSGIVDTEAVLADEKVVDMEPSFRLLDPDTSQFMTITATSDDPDEAADVADATQGFDGVHEQIEQHLL